MLSMETDRLILREFRREDFADVHDYASDPDVARYMPWGPNTEEQTVTFLEQVIRENGKEPREQFEMAMVLKDAGRVIGSCRIHITSAANREGFLGYCLHRRYWSQGYTTEAAEALLGYGFDHLHLHRLFATCDPRNIGSARVMEKIGMRREGHLRQHTWQRGGWRDSLVYAILEHEYR